jgi:hypothetical protein
MPMTTKNLVLLVLLAQRGYRFGDAVGLTMGDADTKF